MTMSHPPFPSSSFFLFFFILLFYATDTAIEPGFWNTLDARECLGQYSPINSDDLFGLARLLTVLAILYLPGHLCPALRNLVISDSEICSKVSFSSYSALCVHFAPKFMSDRTFPELVKF